MKKLILFLSLMLVSISVMADDVTYLCIPKKSTGFYYDKSSKDWTNTTFNMEKEKYLIKKKGTSWEWSKFGEKDSYNFCKPQKVDNKLNQVSCWTFGGELTFNPNSLRYLHTYLYGYLSGVDNNDNTPAITIGTCSPL